MTCNTSAVAVCCSSASRCSVEQPRVLHRDHRLRGEILQQRDLLVGEWPNLLAEDGDGTEQVSILAERDNELTARAAEISNGSATRIPGSIGVIVGDVRDMHHIFALDDPCRASPGPRSEGFPQIFRQAMTDALRRGRVKILAVVGIEDTKLRTRKGVSPSPSTESNTGADRRVRR